MTYQPFTALDSKANEQEDWSLILKKLMITYAVSVISIKSLEQLVIHQYSPLGMDVNTLLANW